MKALSIIQPWAELIVLGHKDIENRTWPTKVRGWVAVHASKSYSRAEWEFAQSALDDVREFVRWRIDLPSIEKADVAFGAIIGTVEIVDCVTASESPWFFGKYGFVLRNPVKFDKPIPCRGALGFWEFPGVRNA